MSIVMKKVPVPILWHFMIKRWMRLLKSEEKSSNPQAYQVNLWIDKSLHKRVSLKNFRTREPQIINDLLYFEVGEIPSKSV